MNTAPSLLPLVLVRLHALPAGVTSLSGISLARATGTAWACGTGGMIYNLGGFPCEVTDVCVGGPEPGAACDDGNANTADDVVTEDGTCVGNIGTGLTPVEPYVADLRLWSTR